MTAEPEELDPYDSLYDPDDPGDDDEIESVLSRYDDRDDTDGRFERYEEFQSYAHGMDDDVDLYDLPEDIGDQYSGFNF